MGDLGASYLSILGALHPLRPGEYVIESHGPWYSSVFAYDESTAWAVLEALLDSPAARVPDAFGLPHRCASFRFGNVTAFTVEYGR